MWKAPDNDHYSDEIFLAGEIVAPGLYRQIGGMREIAVDRHDYLPASLDGRVACYRRISRSERVAIGAGSGI